MYHCILLCFLGGTTLVVYNYSFHKYKLIHQAVWFPLKYLSFFHWIFWLFDSLTTDSHCLSNKHPREKMRTLCHAFSLQELHATSRNNSVLSKAVLALEIKCKFNPSGLLTEMPHPPHPPNLSHWVTENVT